MNIAELRIGNLFYGDISQSEVYKVSYITEGTEWLIGCGVGTDYWKISNVVGIPLTEEWLVRFGFIGPGFNQYFDHLDCNFSIVKYNNLWQLHVMGAFDTITLCEIEYVHQLQNIYFALTGEELIIV